MRDPRGLSNLFRVPSSIANPEIEKLVSQKGGVTPLGCVNLKSNERGSDK